MPGSPGIEFLSQSRGESPSQEAGTASSKDRPGGGGGVMDIQVVTRVLVTRLLGATRVLEKIYVLF